ncbi:LLM class flavin-dependent oxidoreductase [Streptomyces avidinii]|uniref:LLM class flavin-dependent oxidoreductase n=1 Tax=Streptomyces avidinii TaxID=1895 RepID=UPI0037ABD3C5
MDLDVLYEIDVPRPWPGTRPHGRRTAERMGFRTVRAVEHHFREGRSHCPAPEVLLGHLAGLTEQIRLGFGVILTPFGFTPPQRIAEKVATVDVLSGGRVEWGTGRSTPMEQAAFGLDRERSREDWREAIGIVTGMRREEYFEYASERFRFPRRMVTPKPVQDPHPPAWTAATSPGSAEVAGAAGLGLLSFSIMQPLEAMARQVAAYRAGARVWDSAAWWYSNLARFTLEWVLPHLAAEERDRAFPLLGPILEGDVPVREFSDGDMILIGDAETIVGKAGRYADLGVDQLICSVQWGYLEHREILRTIEIPGKEVIPELARYVPRAAGA